MSVISISISPYRICCHSSVLLSRCMMIIIIVTRQDTFITFRCEPIWCCCFFSLSLSEFSSSLVNYGFWSQLEWHAVSQCSRHNTRHRSKWCNLCCVHIDISLAHHQTRACYHFRLFIQSCQQDNGIDMVTMMVAVSVKWFRYTCMCINECLFACSLILHGFPYISVCNNRISTQNRLHWRLLWKLEHEDVWCNVRSIHSVNARERENETERPSKTNDSHKNVTQNKSMCVCSCSIKLD